VIKRLFGEHLMSRLTRTQNRELSFRCITYNMHRLTNLVIQLMFSTKPIRDVMSCNYGYSKWMSLEPPQIRFLQPLHTHRKNHSK
ncbi:MAG TPA: hypothetical protein VH796_18585, partial [Nitrososphaeraceae archaeon]